MDWIWLDLRLSEIIDVLFFFSFFSFFLSFFFVLFCFVSDGWADSFPISGRSVWSPQRDLPGSKPLDRWVRHRGSGGRRRRGQEDSLEAIDFLIEPQRDTIGSSTQQRYPSMPPPASIWSSWLLFDTNLQNWLNPNQSNQSRRVIFDA